MERDADHADRSERDEMILSLVFVPGRGRKGTPEDVLRYFGVTDGQKLGLDLLQEALRRRDGDDVEIVLIVSFTFGFTPDHLQPLLELAFADWHRSHEDIITALQDQHTPATIPAFVHATRWAPEYLDWDDNRALAKKAIHALGRTPGNEAENALIQLVDSDDDALRETARRVLERRRRGHSQGF
jgi:hypothetical protein